MTGSDPTRSPDVAFGGGACTLRASAGFTCVLTGREASGECAVAEDAAERGLFDVLGVKDIRDAFKVRSPKAGVIPETWEGPGLLIGVDVLVDKHKISLPCTTKLSLDFLRSNVSISNSKRVAYFNGARRN